MSADLSPGAAAQPPTAAKNVRWTLLGVMLAMLLGMLDTNVVGTALPTIVGDLGGLNHISWVVTAYTLTTAVSTPVWGKLGDLYGRKRLFQASIVVFLLGSALTGAAQSMPELIGFRALQGIGAGGLGAGAFALIASLVPPRERGRYQGMTASVMAIGTIGGPLLGGVITGHLGWRWAFYMNLPLGLIALVWVQLMLHLPAARIKAKIDWVGITLLTVAITTLVMAATWAGTTYAWGSWQIAALAAGAAVALAAFIASQRRVAEPVMPLRIFTGHRNFPLAVGVLLVAGVVMFGCSLYIPVFQQTVQGDSATNSGLLLLPLMLPAVIVSTMAGKVMSRTGKYKVFPILGTAFMAVGTLLLSTMDTSTTRLTSSFYLALVGIGLGFALQMANTIAQNSVGMRDIGAASASTNLFRTLGGSLGVAVFGSLFTAATANAGTGSRGSAHPSQAYLTAVAAGTQHIFLVAAVVCAVGFVVALFIKEVPLQSRPTTVAPASAPATAAVPTGAQG